MLIAVPVKPFDLAKGRLSGLLAPDTRRRLATRTAMHVVRTALSTGARVAVVTEAEDVASWARAEGCRIVDDPGRGLNAAAAAAVEEADGGPWCIVHADLPLIGPVDMARVCEAVGPGAAVLCPSRDGGTNLFGAAEPLEFAYGPGSFSRHLSATAHLDRRVVVTTGTSVDIDSPADVAGAARLPAGAWLRTFLEDEA
ncbi:MAG: 2-phospho-L-lactate guanylyltransferase [Acidimicrobiia bacterium]|nr:2-phospho-L-lactate guanylyltransferase [Acidimicrobiia bacterium]